MPPHRPFQHTPEQQRQKSHEPSGFETFRLLQTQPLDQHRICEQPVVLLRAVWLLVYGEHLSGPRGEVPCGRDMREQDEAARLFLQTGKAFCLSADGGLQPISQGFDGARFGGTRPAPAILRPFLNGDIQQMIRSAHSSQLRRCSFRISAAEIRLLLCGARSGLQGTLRRLDRTFQPLLPSFVRRAGVANDRPIGCPVERDLALIGFLGRARTVRWRLRVGDDAEFCPRVVGHRLSDEPSACIVGGG